MLSLHLQPCNTETLCKSVVNVTQSFCPSVPSQAQEIKSKFQRLFNLFHKCHAIYDKNAVTEEEISQPGMYHTHSLIFYLIGSILFDQYIKEFMSYYRTTFPESTVLPKMHFLEEHMIPWLRRWHVGFGMMGEQGAESIHAYFNSLAYQSIPDRVQRVKHMLKEHHLHVAPPNVAARPAIKKRKKIVAEE